MPGLKECLLPAFMFGFQKFNFFLCLFFDAIYFSPFHLGLRLIFPL